VESIGDQASHVDPSSTTHLQQQQKQQQPRPQYHDQSSEDHDRQYTENGGGEQLHTLSGSPYTATDAPTDTTALPAATTSAKYTRVKLFRRWAMRMATVPRLQILWGLLALFGSMAWFSMMPAYAFR